jgi:hypothetical protein
MLILGLDVSVNLTATTSVAFSAAVVAGAGALALFRGWDIVRFFTRINGNLIDKSL